MKRRTFLATTAGSIAATAGCLGDVVGSERKPILVRAMPATGDETEVSCELAESFVRDHEALASSLREARDNAVHEWATTAVSLETGERLSHDLEHACETSGGIYHYRDDEFMISITPRGTSTVGLDHGGHTHTTDGER